MASLRQASGILIREFFLVTIVFFMTSQVWASHFGGGSISWQSTNNSENPYQVRFTFRMGWAFNSGPGCTQSLLGHFLTSSENDWRCTSGCNVANQFLANSSYYCTGASASATEGWEQGERSFTFNFPGQGPFIVAHESCCWRSLGGGLSANGWTLMTTVDLRLRSDTGQPDASPISLSKPIY